MKRLIRRNERPIYTVPKTGFEEARISADPRGSVEVVWCRMGPGGGTGDELLSHGSETECVYVLRGKLDLVVGDEEYTLAAGDCLTIPGEMLHGCFNHTDKDVELLWVTTPAGLLTSRPVDVVAQLRCKKRLAREQGKAGILLVDRDSGEAIAITL